MLALAALAGCAAPPASTAIGGDAPRFARPLTPSPAPVAILGWSPGLDDGWTPQGVAVAGDTLFVAAYRTAEPDEAAGCRVFALDARSARVRASIDVPGCRHAGGIAWAGGGRLYVADTHALYRIDGALPGNVPAVQRWPLTAPLTGSFAAYADGSLWLGGYTRREDGPGTAWQLPESRLDDRTTLDATLATRTVQIPARTQGAAIAADGSLWLTQSGGDAIGRLERRDARDGRLLASYDVPAGIEDIEFDDRGTVWAVSKAGARRYPQWRTFFPVVFAIDTTCLTPRDAR